jgi:hypothetical protein
MVLGDCCGSNRFDVNSRSETLAGRSISAGFAAANLASISSRRPITGTSRQRISVRRAIASSAWDIAINLLAPVLTGIGRACSNLSGNALPAPVVGDSYHFLKRAVYHGVGVERSSSYPRNFLNCFSSRSCRPPCPPSRKGGGSAGGASSGGCRGRRGLITGAHGATGPANAGGFNNSGNNPDGVVSLHRWPL